MPLIVLILAMALGFVTTSAINAYNRREYLKFANRIGWLVMFAVIGLALVVMQFAEGS